MKRGSPSPASLRSATSPRCAGRGVSRSGSQEVRKTWVWAPQLYAGHPNPCDIEDTYISADQSTEQIYLTDSDCDGYMTVQVH